MTKDQEEKFEALWSQDITYGENDKTVARSYYEACLEANSIGATPPESSAPQWVIDMMRTGKPVRCKVWDGIEEVDKKVFVTGYDVKDIHPFCDEYGTTWHHAEPIPAWKPKDGEAVLYHHPKGICVAGVYSGGRVYYDDTYGAATQNDMKPFDASNIGKTWSEI